MDVREVEMQAQLTVQPFTTDGRLDKEALIEMASELLRAEQEAEAAARPRRQGVARRKQTRKEKVNLLRDRARAEMFEGEVANLDSLAARLGVHRSTAKKLRDRYLLTGTIPAYEYNNQHPPEVAEEVIGIMSSEEAQYFTTTDVKRRLPNVSKKFIARTLRQHGYRYRRIRHTRQRRVFSEAEVCRVVSTCLPAFDRADETLLFLDEVIFPLNHTPKHCWRNTYQSTGGFYERTTCETKLTAIALCSKTRMIAIQIHTQEMESQAVIHFLTEALRRVRTPERVVVLLDNARYHSSAMVMQSSIAKYLVRNVPECWELNMIELCFSKLKHLWRTRAVVRCAEEEVPQLIRLFRECQIAQDFAGYRRQYLRNVQQMLSQR